MQYKTKALLRSLSTIIVLIAITCPALSAVIIRSAKSTITPVEMDIGDTLKFTLRNGQTRVMVLQETDAGVVITNLGRLKTDQPGGGTAYYFTCKLSFDGHAMFMKRFVGTQESFYEPYVINGMRIWFDGVSKIADIILDNHGGHVSGAIPEKQARFAVADMTDDISPSKLSPIYINNQNLINIADCYNGDDCWMGAYNGVELHGGLDINQPRGNPNFTPFPIDSQYFYNSLAKGDNNNRWRGIHKWGNGDTWIFQNAHMLNLLTNEHEKIDQGVHYAECCGVHLGNNEHAHYIFKVIPAGGGKEFQLDPWILFWQIFQDNKNRNKELIANIAPFSPGKTNAAIRFSGEVLNGALRGKKLSYYWVFGDGGFSTEKNPVYTFANPGIYPVTLMADDGATRSTFTQHITIDGEKIGRPSFALSSPDEPSFRKRPLDVMDVYGSAVKFIPHSLRFLARATNAEPDAKIIMLENMGNGSLPKAGTPKIVYTKGSGWLEATPFINKDNRQALSVRANGKGLSTGLYSALVMIDCPGAVNSRQSFVVELNIPSYLPSDVELGNSRRDIIDNEDIRYNRFYATPYFWVGPRFKRWEERGYNNFYLTNGARAVEGEFARFRPDLAAGKYELSFAKETPFDPKRRAISGGRQFPVDSSLNAVPGFMVRIHSKSGDKKQWIEPDKSLIIGQFEFSEGMDGFVDILSEGSVGQILVDAIVFRRLE